MLKLAIKLSAAGFLFILVCLPGLSTVPPAQAQWDNSEYEEPGGNAVVRFIKSHPAGCGLAFLVILFGGFALIMGPGDLLDSYLHGRRKSVISPEMRHIGGAKGIIASILVDGIDKARNNK